MDLLYKPGAKSPLPKPVVSSNGHGTGHGHSHIHGPPSPPAIPIAPQWKKIDSPTHVGDGGLILDRNLPVIGIFIVYGAIQSDTEFITPTLNITLASKEDSGSQEENRGGVQNWKSHKMLGFGRHLARIGEDKVRGVDLGSKWGQERAIRIQQRTKKQNKKS